MRSAHSPSLQSRYDYYYSSPTATTTPQSANYYDNQHASLFGDPVPPSTGFIENLDNHLYGSLRRFDIKKSSSSHILDDFSSNSSYNLGNRYYSAPLRDNHQTATTLSGNSDLYNVNSSISNNNNFIDHDRGRPPNMIATGDPMMYSSFRRSNSSLSNDFRTSLEMYRNQHSYSPSSINRRKANRIFSSDSSATTLPGYYNLRRRNSSNDWMSYKADLDNWSNIPRPQHKLKNVTQLNHGSSSSDETTKNIGSNVIRVGAGKPNVNKFSVLPYTKPANVNDSVDDDYCDSDTKEVETPKKSRTTVINVADDDDFEQEEVRIKPKQALMQQTEATSTSDEDREISVSPSRKIEPSPVILTDKITTGSNHRLLPPGRQHKKPSFTIINELSPNQSRAPSPTPSNSGRTSPFFGRGFKPPYYNYRNSLDSIDQVGNRPAVHFGKTLIGSQPRSRSSMSLTPRSILTTKHTKKENYEIQTDKLRASTLKPRSTSLSRTNTNLSAQVLEKARLRRANSYTTTSYVQQKKSFEMLPFEKSQIPRLSSRNKQTQTQPSLLRGKTLILDEKLETTNSKPPINPRSHHKGVMKVVKSEAEGSPSKIPKRTGKDTLTVAAADAKGKGKVAANAKKTGALKKTTTPQTAEDKKPKADGEPDETEEEERKEDEKGKTAAKGKTTAVKNGKKQLTRTNSNLSNKSNASKVSTISKKFGPAAKESAIKAASAFSKFSKAAKNKLTSSKSDADKKSETEAKEKVEKEKVEKEKKETEEKDSIAKAAITSPSKIPVRQTSNPKIEIKAESPMKMMMPPEPKSPTKSVLSVSIKKSFGLSSVSKALTRSFRRKKKEGSESGDTDSLASVSTFRSNLLKRTDSSSTIQTNAPTKQESAKNSATLGRESASSKTTKKEPSMLKKQISNLSRKISDIETAKKMEQARVEMEEVITEPVMQTHREVDEENLAANDATKSIRSKEASDTESYNKKLVPMTKTNVVSMTTAAITAQPVQISTTVTNQLGQVKEPAYEDNYSANDPSSLIIEKSQKTLEDVQKTVKAATTEIQKSITANLSNLKTLEQEVNKNLMPPPDHNTTANLGAANASGGNAGGYILETIQENSPKSSLSEQSIVQSIPQQPISKTTTLLSISRPNTTQSNNPIEASVSVINEKLSRGTTPNSLPQTGDDAENERLRPPGYTSKNNNNNDDNNNNNNNNKGDKKSILVTRKSDSTMKLDELEAHGNSAVFVEGEQAQFEYDDDLDSNLDESPSQNSDASSRGCCGNRKCCKCCRKLCLPCKKICRVSKCCRRKTNNSNSSSNNNNNNNNSENSIGEKKNCCGSCLRKLYCCGRSEEKEKERKMKSSSRPPPTSGSVEMSESDGKCGKCLGKMFCCRTTNKIEASNTYRMRKCCFCIPCGKKVLPNEEDAQIAWANRRESINNDMDQRNCCSRFFSKLNCCKKKNGADAESRRTSKNSKAQSIAPTLPPEDNRPKLDLILVEHTSKMKAAIPVLPICLAWFCAVCNFIIPGLGTIFSGILCLCIGIPRFSQHDNAKGRIGSFIINLIVGISQAFCLLFCLVGYGWSAWWGVIMIRTARKHRRIKDAEIHEPSPVLNRATVAQVVSQNHRDVEAGR